MQTSTRWWRLWVLTLVPLAAHASGWPDTPLPPDTNAADVAKHMIYNGVDMHAQVFQSTASQAQVIAFYRKAWGKDAVLNVVGDAQVVGHREGKYMVTVQVRSVGDGSKGTIGVLDTASAEPDFVPGKGMPKPMGSRVFNDIRYPDDPVPARTVAMQNSLSPQQNASYFRERLVAESWKPADANNCDGPSCVLYYQRGDSKMTLVMTQAEGRSQVVINVLEP